MEKILTVILFISFGAKPDMLFAQSDSIELIEKMVDKIDNDKALKFKKYDANDVYNTSFDGGGNFYVFYEGKKLIKMIREIGTSFGRVSRVAYFSNGLPIKIIDKEENFLWKEDNSGWDYSQLNEVYREVIYVFDWESDNNEIIREGKRNLSEGVCGIFEYEPFFELGEKLMEEAIHK